MAAVDTSGNRSDLSERMSGQAIDLTAPAAPGWDDPAALPEVISQVMGTVQLTWLPVDDPSGVSYLVQRQVSGSPLWLGISGWIEGNAAPQFVDSDVPPGQSYSYRVRAMDGAGNRSDWSDVIAVDVPMP